MTSNYNSWMGCPPATQDEVNKVYVLVSALSGRNADERDVCVVVVAAIRSQGMTLMHWKNTIPFVRTIFRPRLRAFSWFLGQHISVQVAAVASSRGEPVSLVVSRLAGCSAPKLSIQNPCHAPRHWRCTGSDGKWAGGLSPDGAYWRWVGIYRNNLI